MLEPTTMSASRKYKTLTLKEKVDVISAVEDSGRTKSEIAKEYVIPLSTLSTYLKNKDKIIEGNCTITNPSLCGV